MASGGHHHAQLGFGAFERTTGRIRDRPLDESKRVTTRCRASRIFRIGGVDWVESWSSRVIPLTRTSGVAWRARICTGVCSCIRGTGISRAGVGPSIGLGGLGATTGCEHENRQDGREGELMHDATSR